MRILYYQNPTLIPDKDNIGKQFIFKPKPFLPPDITANNDNKSEIFFVKDYYLISLIILHQQL